MIEHLPQELRDRFTEMRELDLSVHNNMDTLEKRVKSLFSECKRMNDSTPATNSEFKAIHQEYYKVLEDADEKVHLANTMYDLVDKYLRRLDTELLKFKCELEADNKGITELLEKRSFDLDTPIASASLSSQKENRYERYRPRAEKRRDSGNSINAYVEKRQAVGNNVPIVENRHTAANNNSNMVIAQNSINTNSSAPQYNLNHIGAGPAIAAAASQAIAATQQMQQGRRTASLKASYEAIHTRMNVNDFVGRELAGAAQTAIQAIQQDSNKKKQKKFSTAGSSSAIQQQIIATQQPVAVQPTAAPAVEVQTQEVTDGEWTYDPNEPRYCLCNQVSYGDMVACDNEDCPSEWFHYPCVDITAPPKGKWYCPQCTITMRRRGGRKN